MPSPSERDDGRRPAEESTPLGVRRGYVRWLTLAMAAVVALALLWALLQGVLLA